MSPTPSGTLRIPRLSAVALLLATAAGAGAQIKASEKGSVAQVISGTELEIEYYRPSVRNRSPIFGGVVYWGEVWTPGANYATTLRVSKDVKVNGVAVEAGRYGVWIEVLEDAPWTLLLHGDTVRGHGNHPEVHEGIYAIPVHPETSDHFVETLTFSFERVRSTSAELRFEWADTRVRVELGIDPGIRTALTAEEAAAIDGEWVYDDTPSLPSREEADRDLARADERGFGAPMRRYYDALFALARPRSVRLEWNQDTGAVSFQDPLADAVNEAWDAPEAEEEERGPGGTWGQVLVPRGGGSYSVAGMIDGELASFSPEFAALLEFEFDEAGRAIRFTHRWGDDVLRATAVRPPESR